MTDLTPAQLDEWQALADAATTANWRSQETRVYFGKLGGFDIRNCPNPEANAAFIATARAAVPALIAEVEKCARLKEERDIYKAACKRAGVCMSCVLSPPNPYGCTDCMNTGWDQGSPVEAREAIARAEEAEAENARLLVELENRIAGFNYAASSENELILERDTAVVRAEKAEAENARLWEALEQAYTVLSFAFNRIHALPHSRDTALASDIGKVRAQIAAALKGEKSK